MHSILIVEDSALLRAVVKESLETAGFRTIEAEDGKIGLEKALSEHPSLIMLDLMMPVMDGLTMFKLLRKDEWGAHVPVVMLTGTDKEKVTSWVDGEEIDFLMKENWMMDEVVSRVKAKLGIV